MKHEVLLVSHGTVDALDDLAAFVTNVRRGHAPPPELVAELRRRYEAIGGSSPLNRINVQLADALATKLGVPVRWANRLWKPTVRDALRGIEADGAEQVAVVPLAQHSAHVYADDARKAAEGTRLTLRCASNWGQDAKLSTAFAKRIVDALRGLDRARTTVVMTAHSLPKSVVDRGDPYEREVRASAEAIARAVGPDLRWTLAFQSQGMSDVPGGWLGPDLPTTIADVAARGDRAVVFAPVGFLADHVEILYDLDIEAAAMVRGKGMTCVRARSLNADEDFVDLLVDVARPLLGDG
ncbi:MAG TPA: ferrochelatase [Polyangiaceae bacterium]